jgi:hypothetical protein
MRQHIPKKHCNFDEPIVNKTKMDSTTDRIYGALTVHPMVPESYKVGTGKNPADLLPKHGMKTINAEKEVSDNEFEYFTV